MDFRTAVSLGLEKTAIRRSDVELLRQFPKPVSAAFDRLKRAPSQVSPLRAAIDESIASGATSQRAVDKVIRADAAKNNAISLSGRLDGTIATSEGVTHGPSLSSDVAKARREMRRVDPLAARAARVEQVANSAYRGHLARVEAQRAAEQARLQALPELYGTGQRVVEQVPAAQNPISALWNRLRGRPAPTVTYERFIPPNVPGGLAAHATNIPLALPRERFRQQALKAELERAAAARALQDVPMPRYGLRDLSGGFQAALRRGYRFGAGRI